MKIIKVGRTPPEEDWTHTFECKKCKAEVEITVADLKTYHYFGTHFRHDYLGAKCPLCGEIFFANKVIPDPIYDKYLDEKHSVFDGTDDSIY